MYPEPMSRNGYGTSARGRGGACTREVGLRAETAAAKHLHGRGFDILGRNIRVGRYEVDLLVRSGAVVAVVEVRARDEGAWVRPLDSLDSGKRARLRAAGASLWRTRFAGDSAVTRMRFDCVSVRLREGVPSRIEHFPGAF